MLRYQWQGMDAVQARLEALADQRGLDDELESSGDVIVKEAQDYPPELPGQRYQRTYNLRDTWRRSQARRAGRAVIVDIDNPMEYGPAVMGENQEPSFKGRWKRLRAIGDAQRGALHMRARAWALRTWRGG